MLTAGVMGLVKKFRYILVTDALLNNLSSDEIDSVIAHEIGHVKKYHLQFYLIFFLGFLFLFYSLQDILIFSVSYLNYLMLAAGLFNTVSYPAVYTVFNVVFMPVASRLLGVSVETLKRFLIDEPHVTFTEKPDALLFLPGWRIPY